VSVYAPIADNSLPVLHALPRNVRVELFYDASHLRLPQELLAKHTLLADLFFATQPLKIKRPRVEGRVELIQMGIIKSLVATNIATRDVLADFGFVLDLLRQKKHVCDLVRPSVLYKTHLSPFSDKDVLRKDDGDTRVFPDNTAVPVLERMTALMRTAHAKVDLDPGLTFALLAPTETFAARVVGFLLSTDMLNYAWLNLRAKEDFVKPLFAEMSRDDAQQIASKLWAAASPSFVASARGTRKFDSTVNAQWRAVAKAAFDNQYAKFAQKHRDFKPRRVHLKNAEIYFIQATLRIAVMGLYEAFFFDLENNIVPSVRVTHIPPQPYCNFDISKKAVSGISPHLSESIFVHLKNYAFG